MNKHNNDTGTREILERKKDRVATTGMSWYDKRYQRTRTVFCVPYIAKLLLAQKYEGIPIRTLFRMAYTRNTNLTIRDTLQLYGIQNNVRVSILWYAYIYLGTASLHFEFTHNIFKRLGAT